MVCIAILSVGKNKEVWLTQAIEEYAKRLKSTLQLSFQWVVDDTALGQAASQFRRAIALDPQGKGLDSLDFADYLQKEVTESGGRLAFLIGGPDGLPASIRQERPLLSLSPLTLTHQITRLVLVEQIYRATQIWRGSPYPR